MDKFFKERSNQYLILGAAIVFAVVALGACGHIAYEKNAPQKQKTTSANASSPLVCEESEEMALSQCASKLHALGYTIIPPSDGKEDTKKEEEKKEEDSGVIDYEADIIDTQSELVAEAKLKPEERINKILAKAKQIMNKYSDGEGKVVDKNDLVVSVLHKNGIYSSSRKQKGVALRFVSNNGEYKSLQWRNQYDWGIKGIFERRGFLSRDSFSYVDMYENGEAITCKSSFVGDKEGDEEAHYYYVSCTLNSWYPKEDYELLAALTDAVRRATGSKISGLNYTSKNIENSPKSPYQRIAGTSLFYRTSPNSEWKYFRSAVHVIPCSEFNTDELKNAFYGIGCSKGEEVRADGKVGID